MDVEWLNSYTVSDRYSTSDSYISIMNTSITQQKHTKYRVLYALCLSFRPILMFKTVNPNDHLNTALKELVGGNYSIEELLPHTKIGVWRSFLAVTYDDGEYGVAFTLCFTKKEHDRICCMKINDVLSLRPIARLHSIDVTEDSLDSCNLCEGDTYIKVIRVIDSAITKTITLVKERRRKAKLTKGVR